MRPAFIQILRSRWFAVCVLAGLGLLLWRTAGGIQGRAPEFQEKSAGVMPARSAISVRPLQGLFADGVWPKPGPETNAYNPFLTRHFIPAVAPAPPPPTTRKIELTYQGFYQTAEGPLRTIVRQGDAYLITPLGGKVTANLYAASATMQALILTNPAAQTNLLPLNTKKELQVPIP